MCYRGGELTMHLSHMLPIYKATLPLYDTALPRIAKYLEKNSNEINIVDVGANIGDTASLIFEKSNSSNIICIEGSEEFCNLLDINFKENPRVSIEKIFLTDTEISTKTKLVSQGGTATLFQNKNDEENIVQVDTLDNILMNNYPKVNVDLIKVDTDGFDYKVIRGSQKIIQKYKPLIYFELVPMLLRNNSEEVMSIFDFLSKHCYTEVILYDNLGYLMGLYSINDTKNIEMMINYIDSKDMYLDVLVSVDSLDLIYQNEIDSIKDILKLDNLEIRYGYENKKGK